MSVLSKITLISEEYETIYIYIYITYSVLMQLLSDNMWILIRQKFQMSDSNETMI